MTRSEALQIVRNAQENSRREDKRLPEALQILGLTRADFRRCMGEMRQVTSGRPRFMILCPVGTAR